MGAPPRAPFHCPPASSGVELNGVELISLPNQQGWDAQRKLRGGGYTTHSAYGFCTFGTKSYAQSALINNHNYYCTLLNTPSSALCRRIARSVGTYQQNWHAPPFLELGWKLIKGPLLVGSPFLLPSGGCIPGKGKMRGTDEGEMNQNGSSILLNLMFYSSRSDGACLFACRCPTTNAGMQNGN